LTKQAGTIVTISRPKTASRGDSPQETKEESDTVTRVLDLDELQEGSADERAFVFSGDSISVSKAPPIYVTGEVNRPGEFQWEKRMTVRQAVSLAGGPTNKGAMERSKIIRTQDGKEIELKPDLNDSVKPYDIIRVPQSYF
jgi:polysaccharide biosynthesis/export protein